MNPVLLDVNIVVASLVLFAAAYAVARIATRPLPVAPDEATPELGDQPPAVVNLLANRWKLTADAAEATLLDLAARGYLELRQASSSPSHTTIHLTDRADDAELMPYERRVLYRVQDMAVGGVVPVGALAFRNRPRGRRWSRRFRRQVVIGARRRGLSRRRVGETTASLLLMAAVASAGGLGVVAFRGVDRTTDNWDLASWAAVAAFGTVLGILLIVMAATDSERDTLVGRRVAARWLGVRRWLRAHEGFADLPPAAVTVWGRYLAYGAALGVTHTTSEVLDLGMGDRRTVWSSYGGHWRRVRVRHPRLRFHYGRRARHLAVRGAAAVLAGVVVLQLLAPPWSEIPLLAEGMADVGAWLRWSLAPLGPAAMAYGCYVLARTAIAHATTRTVTGEVLWRETAAGMTSAHIVIDDGRHDRATIWLLPGGPTRVQDRDVVTVRVVPWTRRVVHLTVLERGRPGGLRDSLVPELPDTPEGRSGQPPTHDRAP